MLDRQLDPGVAVLTHLVVALDVLLDGWRSQHSSLPGQQPQAHPNTWGGPWTSWQPWPAWASLKGWSWNSSDVQGHFQRASPQGRLDRACVGMGSPTRLAGQTKVQLPVTRPSCGSCPPQSGHELLCRAWPPPSCCSSPSPQPFSQLLISKTLFSIFKASHKSCCTILSF